MLPHRNFHSVGDNKCAITQRGAKRFTEGQRNQIFFQYASLEEQCISLRIQGMFSDTYGRQTTPLCLATVTLVIRLYCVSAVILPPPWTETPTAQMQEEQQGV